MGKQQIDSGFQPKNIVTSEDLNGLQDRPSTTSVLSLTLVLGELNPETFLRVRDPFHGGQRNRERAVADGAHSYNRNRADPFDHS
jgi:hypothetical protein